ncbi:hypothetical protein EDD11_005636 [Mortierella claussenii]|nr:hypothetical protein EDD11_005636 [Mortierella claussenii]
MVKINNKTVVFLKPPLEYPLPGEHLGVESWEVDDHLDENEVRTRNLYISLDPYLRGRMHSMKAHYISWYEVGKPLDSGVIAEVVASKNAKYPVGTIVSGHLSWQEYTRVPANQPLQIINDPHHPKISLSSYLGVLGMPGLTAYGSLIELGKPKAGETIYISAASGAVGQLVGQIAKRLGLRVIGSAGSDAKVQYLLNDLHFDHAFNYKTLTSSLHDTLRSYLAPHSPQFGLDIYYDNVGGEHLEAAIDVLNLHGRIIACGMIGDYNAEKPYHVKNLLQIVFKSLKIFGFVVSDFGEEVQARFQRDVKQWLEKGEIVYREDVTEGLENAPEAFLGLLQGKNFGKAVIKVADP